MEIYRTASIQDMPTIAKRHARTGTVQVNRGQGSKITIDRACGHCGGRQPPCLSNTISNTAVKIRMLPA
jgi:hypothetical protein